MARGRRVRPVGGRHAGPCRTTATATLAKRDWSNKEKCINCTVQAMDEWKTDDI